MNRIIYSFFTIIIFCASCNNQPDKTASTNHEAASENKITTIIQADDPAAKNAAISKLDVLEKLFDNQNYLIVTGKDSSYLYFSRLGKLNFYTHSFKIIKGDSANLKIDTIQINSNNQIQWNWQSKHLQLVSATEFTSKWMIDGNEKNNIEFQRIDNRIIQLIQPNAKQQMKKTLTLSLFLVRSFYDYQHGTNYAQDSVDSFKPKVGKPIKK